MSWIPMSWNNGMKLKLKTQTQTEVHGMHAYCKYLLFENISEGAIDYVLP